MNDITSDELVRDSAAAEISLLVEEFYDLILRFAYHYLGSLDDAQDVTQETFIKVKTELSSGRQVANKKAWIYAIARNLCCDRKRLWQRLFKLHTRILAATHPTACYDTDTNELAAAIQNLVRQLPQRQREVFILRHWHDFSTAETAQLLGLDPGTVKSHLSRAISTIKKELLRTEAK